MRVVNLLITLNMKKRWNQNIIKNLKKGKFQIKIFITIKIKKILFLHNLDILTQNT